MIRLSSGVTIAYVGDGVSTTFSVDLTSQPFNMNFNGRLPVEVAYVSAVGGPTCTATIVGTTVTITMATAATDGQNCSVGVGLWLPTN